ncbi:unnamed protein product, partial [Gongylonema pulchrum]|uniref:Uncharacterized protein n=1 Tax=Gongylonema pulchrum TaxID=637853 RepID=A0A183DRA7_9BILA
MCDCFEHLKELQGQKAPDSDETVKEARNRAATNHRASVAVSSENGALVSDVAEKSVLMPYQNTCATSSAVNGCPAKRSTRKSDSAESIRNILEDFLANSSTSVLPDTDPMMPVLYDCAFGNSLATGIDELSRSLAKTSGRLPSEKLPLSEPPSSLLTSSYPHLLHPNC